MRFLFKTELLALAAPRLNFCARNNRLVHDRKLRARVTNSARLFYTRGKGRGHLTDLIDMADRQELIKGKD